MLVFILYTTAIILFHLFRTDDFIEFVNMPCFFVSLIVFFRNTLCSVIKQFLKLGDSIFAVAFYLISAAKAIRPLPTAAAAFLGPW